jgi:hypothetical protein
MWMIEWLNFDTNIWSLMRTLLSEKTNLFLIGSAGKRDTKLKFEKCDAHAFNQSISVVANLFKLKPHGGTKNP